MLAELLGGKPIFKGRDYIDQLNIVLHFLGTPSDATLRRVGSPRAQDYIRSLPHSVGVPFPSMFPNANPLALDLLTKLLAFDPAVRITCEEALKHPYLAVWHEEADEPECEKKFDFGFEREESEEGMRALIVEEVEAFRRMVRPVFLYYTRVKEKLDADVPFFQVRPTTSAPIPPPVFSSITTSTARAENALPIPTRDEVMASPGGAATADNAMEVQQELPVDELERELMYGGTVV